MSQGISLIAIPWYIANDLGQPDLYGYLILATAIIGMFWGPYAGTLVDKFDRKNVMLGIQSVGLVVIMSVAVWGMLQQYTAVWMAALVMLTTKMLYNIHYPNLYAFAQEITEKEHFGRINSWIEIQGQTTFMLAGALAAFLMEGKIFSYTFEAWPIHQIFLMDAITYVVGFFFIFNIQYTSLVDRSSRFTSTFKERISDGFIYLKKHPLILLFGACSGFVFAAGLICSTYTLPIFINHFLNAKESAYGIAEASFAFGCLLSGFFILKLFSKNHLTLGIIILSIIAALMFVWIGWNKNLMILYLCYGIIGFSNAGIRIMKNTYIFRVIDNNLIGRTGSVFMVLNSLLRVFLILIFSSVFFENGSNIHISMYILAIFIALSSITLILFYQPLRALNQSNEE